MAGVNITPYTIGGVYSTVVAWLGQPVVTVKDGGRITSGGWTGSGADVTVNSYFTDDGSTTGTAGTWQYMFFSQGRKFDPWGAQLDVDYALGSMEPHVGIQETFVVSPDLLATPVDASLSFYDNVFAPDAGPEQVAVRSDASWLAVSSNPGSNDPADVGSVKSYPDTEVNFGDHAPVGDIGGPFTFEPTPFSQFSEHWVYHSSIDPDSGPVQYAGTNPALCYEACFDATGFAHWDRNIGGVLETSLEVMFWTFDHNLVPDTSPLPEGGGAFAIEYGIDLNGDGNLWNLYVYTDANPFGLGGLTYSFFIWYAQKPAVGKYAWVNVLAGMRYCLMHYVVVTGSDVPGYPVPSNPLDCLFGGNSYGYEIRSTGQVPVPFRCTDFRVRQS